MTLKLLITISVILFLGCKKDTDTPIVAAKAFNIPPKPKVWPSPWIGMPAPPRYFQALDINKQIDDPIFGRWLIVLLNRELSPEEIMFKVGEIKYLAHKNHLSLADESRIIAKSVSENLEIAYSSRKLAIEFLKETDPIFADMKINNQLVPY